MNRDEFGPDEVITIDGQPTITVGQLAEIAFTQEAAYRRSMYDSGLGALLPPPRTVICSTAGCDRPAEYVGRFVNHTNPDRDLDDVVYCQRCGYLTHAGGMFVDVTTLYGQPACPVVPYLGKHGTAIGWTHFPGTEGRTIVSVTGCDPASAGCDVCYAERASSSPRLQRLPKYQGVAVNGKWTGVIKMHPQVLEDALRIRKRITWFHNSMSDTFHPRVPDGHIAWHYAVAAATPHHNWIDLTKRHGRLGALLTSTRFHDLIEANWNRRFPDRPFPGWPLPNVAVGVSVENQAAANMRMPHLIRVVDQVPCVFVSAEPLIGRVDLTPWLTGPARSKLWVIAGGESGPGHRPVDLDHVRDLRDQCHYAGVPFFFKQVGGLKPTSGGRELDGAESTEWPAMAYRKVA